MITLSIVSHRHGDMVKNLIEVLHDFPEVSQILVTKNIDESTDFSGYEKVAEIINDRPKGFSANHNCAFVRCISEYFCVMNPDIILRDNPFPTLIHSLDQPTYAMVAPMVLNLQGEVEDSARKFPTIASVARRKWGGDDKEYYFNRESHPFSPDWIGGMFMLFKSNCYREIGGFDERFYLYCEDIDICRKVKLRGRQILLNPHVWVMHDARRYSRMKLKYFLLHLSSLLKYFIKYGFTNK